MSKTPCCVPDVMFVMGIFAEGFKQRAKHDVMQAYIKLSQSLFIQHFRHDHGHTSVQLKLKFTVKK